MIDACEVVRGPYRVMNPGAWINRTMEQLRDDRLESMSARFMHFEPELTGGPITKLAEEMVQAARRGVHLSLQLDGYTLSGAVDQPTSSVAERQEVQRSQRGWFDTFSQHFSRFAITNPVSEAPPKPLQRITNCLGRDHRKVVIASFDSTVNEEYSRLVSFGGMNLSPLQAEGLDLMVETSDRGIVDGFGQLFSHRECFSRSRNLRIDCGGGNTLWQIGGLNPVDPIYDTALKLEQQDGIEKISVWSQYPPDPLKAISLALAAEKGAKVSFCTNYRHVGIDSSTPARRGPMAKYVGLRPQKVEAYSYPSGMMHTKAEVIQWRDGRVAAIIGSHNLTLRNIWGMSEIAVEAINNDLAKAVSVFLDHHFQLMEPLN